MINVGQSGGFQKLLSAFQFFRQFGQQFQCGLFLEAHPAFLMPDRREIYTAFEVSDADLGVFLICLHKEQLQQHTLAAASGTAQQNVGNSGKIHSNRAGEAFSQIQYEGLLGEEFVFPFDHIGQIADCRHRMDEDSALARPIFHFHNSDVQRCLNSFLLVLPDLQRNTLGGELPDGDFGILLIFTFRFQFRYSLGMIDKTDALQLILNGSLSDGGQNEYGDDDACDNQIGDEDILGCKLCNGRDILDLLRGGCDVCLRIPDQDCSQNIQDQENQFYRRVGGVVQSGEDSPQTDFGGVVFLGVFVAFIVYLADESVSAELGYSVNAS